MICICKIIRIGITLSQELQQAKQIYDQLIPDIQKMLKKEYIEPQLRGDDLIKEFDEAFMSKRCASLDWQVIHDILGRVIGHPWALAQAFEKYDDIRFRQSYTQHFVKKINTFCHPSFDGKPLASMAAELTMRKYH